MAEDAIEVVKRCLEAFDLKNDTATYESVGGRVVATVRIRATGVQSGAKVEADFGYLFTLREGRVVRLDFFRSPEGARRAAGLEG